MKWLLSLLMVAFLYVPSFAQERQLAKLFRLKTPDSEVSDAILHLESLSVEDRPFTKYFSTYAIPETKRENAALALSFICHSLQGVTTKEFQGGGYYPIATLKKDGDKEKFVPVQLVKGSDTLWYIDIRNFNWTEKAWETIVKEDGYFLEPIVQHDKSGYLRILSGNSVVRADWFIYNAGDITNQTDNKSQIKIYRELLYAPLAKGPAKVLEFEKIWGIDTIRAREIGNTSATLVTKSKAVAKHNRILFHYRTEYGWYYRSYDVFNQRGLRDYAENIVNFKGHPPTVFDGGEIFATNPLKLQVYDLYNEKEDLADDASGAIVRHLTDVLGDPRVRVPHSCFDCHAAGPLPSENTLAEFIKDKSKIYLKDKQDQIRLERVYLNNNFEDSIVEYQQVFEKSLLKVNGCTPTKNFTAYTDIITWYSSPLDINQAAFECGVTPEQFRKLMVEDNKIAYNKLPFRIIKLLEGKEDIPRDIWAAPPTDGQPGLFEQSMVMIHGLTQIADINVNVVLVKTACSVYVGKDVIGNVKPGDTLEYLSTKKEGANLWYEVKLNGKIGYIFADYCEKR